MGRKHRRDTSARALGRPLPVEHHETWAGTEYVVRALTGLSSTKAYRCPGCEQEIRAGSAHVVAWPAHDADATERRHWHTRCWQAREHRRPGRRRYR